MKKADIWISAVLYMALGVVILTIILAAGVPVINKIRDKNIAIDTKEVMFTLDKNIRTVFSEGPGSRRPLTLEIKKGSFEVDDPNDLIKWDFESKVLLSEKDIEIKEGTLVMWTNQSSQEGKYITNLMLNYSGILDLSLEQPNLAVLTGTNDIILTNIGDGKILITSI